MTNNHLQYIVLRIEKKPTLITIVILYYKLKKNGGNKLIKCYYIQRKLKNVYTFKKKKSLFFLWKNEKNTLCITLLENIGFDSSSGFEYI